MNDTSHIFNPKSLKMNTLNRKTYLTNLFKVLRSDAVGQVWKGDGTIEKQDASYLVSPIDVNEVERMCIDFGLHYELIEMGGIRIYS